MRYNKILKLELPFLRFGQYLKIFSTHLNKRIFNLVIRLQILFINLMYYLINLNFIIRARMTRVVEIKMTYMCSIWCKSLLNYSKFQC
jgi:hypothetical protein